MPKLTGGEHEGRRFWHFYCPGCDMPHGFNDTWTFDGNMESPTVSPSLLTRMPRGDDPEVVCHLFLRNGMLEYLSDCTHALAGQTIPLPDLPDWF